MSRISADGGADDVAVPLFLGIERAHTDDGQLTALDGFVVEREAEPAVLEPLIDEFAKPGLVHWQVAAPEAFDACLIDVKTHDVVSDVREAGGGHEADVAGSDDGDVHRASLPESRCSRWSRCAQAPLTGG